jgi:hypothetical protein
MKNKPSATLTTEEFRNAGYSPQRAAQMAEHTATNWKARDGGSRKSPFARKK